MRTRRRPPTTFRSTSATALIALSIAGCASTPDRATVAADAPLTAQLAGRWESELDGAILVIEATGVFSVDRPARGAEPAGVVVGRWTLGEDDSVEFENLRGSGGCDGVRGSYTAEVVRDTVRFTRRSDDCSSREEHMAWPWRRGASSDR